MLALALLTIATVTLMTLRARSEASTAAGAPASLHPSNRRIAAPGRVESVSGLRELTFDIAGRIKHVYVEEGQWVKQGQLIAELDGDEAQAACDVARANLAVADGRLRSTEQNLAATVLHAKADKDRAAAELALLVAGPRAEEISAAKSEADAAKAASIQASETESRFLDVTGKYANWSKQTYDEAHRQAEAAAAKFAAADAHCRQLLAGSRKEDLDRAQAVVCAAQAEFDRLEKSRPFELSVANALVEQARGECARAEALLKKTRLYSPIDGAVIWKFMHGGEAIDAIRLQPVAVVADTHSLRVRSSVDEADYPYVHPGQKVTITADAFSGVSYQGRVERVGDSAGEKKFDTGEAQERMDVRVVETLIAIDDPKPFKLGLRVSVRFEQR